MGHFIDEKRLKVIGGKGGDGCVSFRREKFIPFGGPDGGHGGDGGNVILVTKDNLHALSTLRGKVKFTAGNGEPGKGSNCTGAKGGDIIIEVPVGTQVKDEDTGFILTDLTVKGQEFIAARGGKGGAGNLVFKNSVNQAPRTAIPGEEGQERNLVLELKLIADVGLVGYPNAGKSTLISKISNAHPEVAAYPFTTLTPSLGVVNLSQWDFFVMADIPGIIVGAHEGKGLGFKFLRHIERTQVLLYLIDCFEEDWNEVFKALKKELKLFNPLLAQKTFVVGINKIDSYLSEDFEERKKAFLKKTRLKENKNVFFISGLKELGLDELKEKLFMIVKEEKKNKDSDQTVLS
ncbi:MAG TPA: GTPase ObgE [Spirochaetia bacterium]|nr:MAG: hypothetical protein A2Y41_13130 [Spirochaetes bacterium GWB1_36_13]HCL57024.1 GTPase ObgE [Spirochaetia bacterium]